MYGLPEKYRRLSEMNDVFSRIFGEMPPARTTVQAHLAEPTMLVEIEAIAFVGAS